MPAITGDNDTTSPVSIMQPQLTVQLLFRTVGICLEALKYAKLGKRNDTVTELRPIEKFLAIIGPRPELRRVDPDKRRAAMEEMAARLPPPADISVEAAMVADVACEWVRAPGSRDDHVVIWMHGGGFSAGSCFTHRGLAGKLARHANARVLTINYRLSPEHIFPAALDDVIAVYTEIAPLAGIAKLGVIGDSAGGALTLQCAVEARDTGIRIPDAMALYSPWLDLTCTANAYTSHAKSDPMIHPDALRMLARDYLKDHPAIDPRASPLFAKLEGLPPTLLQTGSNEVLIDDTLELDKRGRAAGVDITLEIWPEMVHVFQAYGAILPEAHAALARTGRFFKTCWSTAGRG